MSDSPYRTCKACEAPCEFCTSAYHCDKCLPNAGYLLDGDCHDPCPRGFFKGYNEYDRKACVSCHPTCRTCSGELESDCTTC